MRKILFLFAVAAFLGSCNQTVPSTTASSNTLALNNSINETSFHDFVVKDINGKDFAFNKLKGKRVLIVNTASKCGFTPQYEDLQKLYEQYGGENFEIIGFPCNQFMGQEPGSNEEIKAFCQKNYGVSFPMMDKIDVKGDAQHPLYTWLTDANLNGVDDAKVSWNFNKFLVDENGNWVAHLGSRTNPLDEEVVNFAKGS